MIDHARARAMNLLVIGQSHVAAFRGAAQAQRAAVASGPRTRVIHTAEEQYRPEIEGIDPDASDPYAGARFGDTLAATIRDQLDRHSPRVVSVMGGNVHNVLALVRHPRPFDFALPGDDLPVDPGAELIPLGTVRATLKEMLAHDFARLRLLRELAGPFIHLESPPPVGDDAFLAAQAGPWFELMKERPREMAPAGLRRRIWALNSELFREAVEALDCRFQPVPAEVRDEAGFLRTEFAGDATHGNAAYGELSIRMVEAL